MKHTCEFTRSKQSATVDTCQCGRFRHNENNKNPVIAEHTASASEHTPLGSNNSLEDIDKMLDYGSSREAVIRAVNTHEELLAGIAYVSHLSEFQEDGKYAGVGKAFRQLTAKAEGK